MQASENRTLLLCCTTLRVCLSTGTKSTCSLDTHLHLNEYDTDCLLSVCVCVFTFTIHIGYDVRVFLVSVSVELVGTSVTQVEFAQMTFSTLSS